MVSDSPLSSFTSAVPVTTGTAVTTPGVARTTSTRPSSTPSCPQFDRAVRPALGIAPVGHHDDAHAMLPVEPGQQREDRIPRLRIQTPSWLVRQDDRRFVYQCARDCRTLLLTTRELARAPG